MKKYISIFLILLAVLLTITVPVNAFNNRIISKSAYLEIKNINITEDDHIKNQAIKNILKKYNSELLPYSHLFIKASREYEIDPYLLVSISGLESYFGRYMIKNTYNAFGWGSGTIYFNSWEDSIYSISKALKKNYYDLGYNNIQKIGTKYAESITWSERVEYFKDQFKQEENKLKISYNRISR